MSADGQRWFLLNVSPDVREQLGRLPQQPPEGPRHSPVAGIVATDAELDHTLGIALLREARRLRLYATCAVRRILERDSCVLSVTAAFADVDVVELAAAGGPVPLCYPEGDASGITVETFPVVAGPPRFASEASPGHTVGLVLRHDTTGGACAFAPGSGDLDEALLARFEQMTLVLFDGTFWTDDELIRLGIGDRTARQMDHLPISGPDGSLERLGALRRPLRVYTHINNTNPILVDDSPERAEVQGQGLVVGMDGMQFIV